MKTTTIDTEHSSENNSVARPASITELPWYNITHIRQINDSFETRFSRNIILIFFYRNISDNFKFFQPSYEVLLKLRKPKFFQLFKGFFQPSRILPTIKKDSSNHQRFFQPCEKKKFALTIASNTSQTLLSPLWSFFVIQKNGYSTAKKCDKNVFSSFLGHFLLHSCLLFRICFVANPNFPLKTL